MLCPSLTRGGSGKSPAKPSKADIRIAKDLNELTTQRWCANSDVHITFPSSASSSSSSSPSVSPFASPSASASASAASQHHLHVLITPHHGLYRHSSFLFSLHLPSSYPFSPPHVRCLTPVLHPFISFRSGKVYHPILHSEWKPVLSLNTVVFALQLMFFLEMDAAGGGRAAADDGGLTDSAVASRGGSVERDCCQEVRDLMSRDSAMFDCFLESDARVLTNLGLLFLKQIEALHREGRQLLFGCYDAQSQALLYCKGRLVFPQQQPPYLVEFTSAGEGARWAEGSGDYGTERAAEDSPCSHQRSHHASLRVTPGHEMYVQQHGSGKVSWASTRPGRDARGRRPPAVLDPHHKVQAKDLLSDDADARVRMLACAQAGHQPQDTSQRDLVQSTLCLNDRQFAAFLELLGFWLGDGSLQYWAVSGSVGGYAGYVSVSQVKQTDAAWLRSALAEAGLEKGKDWLIGSSGNETQLLINKPTWFDFFDKEFGAKYRGSQSYSPAAAASATAASAGGRLSSSSSSSASPARRPSTATIAPTTPPSGASQRRFSVSDSFSLSSRAASTAEAELELDADEDVTLPPPACHYDSAVSTDCMAAAIAAITAMGDDEAELKDEEDEEEEDGEEPTCPTSHPMKDKDENEKKDDKKERLSAEDEPVKDEPDEPDDNKEEEEPRPPATFPPVFILPPGAQPEPVKSVKWLPLWTLQELSKDEMRLLIRGLQRTDGAFTGGQNVIYTSSARFRDQLIQALLHCGYSAWAGLMYRKGGIRGYSHKQKIVNVAQFNKLSAETKLKYRPILATVDGWKVSWAVLGQVRNTKKESGAAAAAAAGCCWPSMSCQQGVKRVPYNRARDGRAWCVEVEHDDHLIIAQRAHCGPDGVTVTKQSRPIVVGNCLVSQTLDGGFFLGMQWPRNRGDEGQRRLMSAAASREAEDVDADGRKRRRGDMLQLIHEQHRAGGEGGSGEDGDDEDGDDRERKHKQPHRHFMRRSAAQQTPPPPRQSVTWPLLASGGERWEERKEPLPAASGDEEHKDDRMGRADSFSFAALQSSLPTAAPAASTSASCSSSLCSQSFPALAAATLSCSTPSLFSPHSSRPNSLALMQKQHALLSTQRMEGLAAGAAGAALPSSRRFVTTSAAAASGADDGHNAGSVFVPARTLSSVMTDA